MPKKILTSFFVTSISESLFLNVWHWLDNTILDVKTILIGDVNLDKSDLSNTVKVQIFIGRYFSWIYFAIVVEEIQIMQSLISRFMFIFIISVGGIVMPCAFRIRNNFFVFSKWFWHKIWEKNGFQLYFLIFVDFMKYLKLFSTVYALKYLSGQF